MVQSFILYNRSIWTLFFHLSVLTNGINWILISKLDSHAMFRKKLIFFIRPSGKSIYNIYDPQGSFFSMLQKWSVTLHNPHEWVNQYSLWNGLSFEIVYFPFVFSKHGILNCDYQVYWKYSTVWTLAIYLEHLKIILFTR